MTGPGREKLTFEGFLMSAAAQGEVDSEGVFTLSHERSVRRLQEQYSGDPLLGYCEVLQGFRQWGARRVWLETGMGHQTLQLCASFGSDGPDLNRLLAEPLAILDTGCFLHSGTGLLLLQRNQPELLWSLHEADGEVRSWKYDAREGAFLREGSQESSHRRWQRGERRIGKLRVHSPKVLPVFCNDPAKRWRETPFGRDFVSQLAFYGTPLTWRSQPLQGPIPGRLVPTDYWRKVPGAAVGYNWEPLAFQLHAARADDSMSFLSEPFTGAVSEVVSVNGARAKGYRNPSRPDYVSFVSYGKEQRCTIPFRKRWLFGRSSLSLPGFAEFPYSLINPRIEGSLFQVHSKGRPLLCKRLIMLSTALGGPSTVVFTRHGCVLGGRHEDLGVPGVLCVVTCDGLATDLTRRRIRGNDAYQELVAGLRREVITFAHETAGHLPRSHPSLGALRACCPN